MDALTVYLNDRPVGRLAERLGVAPRLMEKEISRLAERMQRQAPMVAAKLAVRFPSPCYERIAEGIRTRIQQIA